MRVDIAEAPDVCKYCRKIMKEPDYPKTLELYRGDMLCLTVDVEEASKLSLNETTLRYRKYRPFDLEGVETRGHTHRTAV